jgi:uncharacterized protein (TIGR02996 family)
LPADALDADLDPLWRDLASRPRDADLHLVLADALQGRGDPRGELIALQHALTRGQGDARELRQRLAGLTAHPALFPPGFAPASTAIVELGFPRALRVDLEQHRQLAPRVEELLAHPCCALLETLELRFRDSGNRPLFASIAAALPRARCAQTLEALFIGTARPQLHRAHLEPAGELCAKLPRLRWLGLRGSATSTVLPAPATAKESARLEGLALELELWDRRQVEALPIRTLRQLTVNLPYRSWGATLLEALERDAHSLRELGLRGPRTDYGLLRALLEGKLLERLRRLDLREAAVNDGDLEQLAERGSAQLARLAEVDLRGSDVGPIGQGILASLCVQLRGGRWNPRDSWFAPLPARP